MNGPAPLRIACGLAVVLAALACAHADVELVKDGASDYFVVLPKDASPSEKWAAKDFVDHIKKMSGAELPIREAGDQEKGVPYLLTAKKYVFIGHSPDLGQPGVPLGTDCGPEGFILKAGPTNVLIVGSGERGAMYGVYTLLEKLGCRWWYPGASTIPKSKDITIPAMHLREVPVMEYRDFLYGEMGDSQAASLWRARNKVNGGFFKDNKPEYGGAWKFDTLVHSYGRLLPTSKYFKDHPEYYALRGGKRNADQPCFSSEGAVKAIADALLAELAEHPEWKFVTVGQNDNNSYCQCDKCKALAEKYESHGGMQLHFAKEVAKIVRQKYPDVWINVPAYRWSRKPPKGIKPDAKGIITLCSIECNFGQPLAEAWPKENAAFKADIEGWSALAPKLYIWDYTTNFTHYILPYPNWYALTPNVKFFADHKVRGYMAQGSHTTNHGQMAPLCMWVLAKAMWNPNADGNAMVKEFCLGYYGPKAGPYVHQYVQMLDAAIQGDNRQPIWCTRGTYLSAPYLSPELMAASDRLFRQAEAAVKDDADLLKRVQADHVPVLYVMIRRPVEMIPAAVKLTPGLTAAQIFREFAAYARAAGISRVRENDSAAQLFDWCDDYAKILESAGSLPIPAELKDADPKTYRLIQTSQLDGQVRFLKKAAGATDGWAMGVVSTGWSIQHKLGVPWDVQVGKTYDVYIRAKATAGEGATTALSVGVYVSAGPRTATKGIKADEVDGTWKTYHLGHWKPGANGGVFYAATGPKGITDAYIDCLWLMEQTEQAPKE
ncbi:MAG TPA: DUF4838 domain-containing protein [Phycisphaerae bacterium]|nr:DUF4838 domain-containing protein [Phycisphaerae bacterium]